MAADTKRQVWRVEQGERETLTFTVLDIEGELFAIDGWDITAVVRERPGGPLLYTWPPEGVVFDSDDNTIRLVIPAPVSAEWTWPFGWYTVTISDPGSDVDDPSTYRILDGPLVIDPA